MRPGYLMPLVCLLAAPALGADLRGTVQASRVRLSGETTAQVNYMHQRGDLRRIADNSVDFTLTYSVRYR